MLKKRVYNFFTTSLVDSFHSSLLKLIVNNHRLKIIKKNYGVYFVENVVKTEEWFFLKGFVPTAIDVSGACVPVITYSVDNPKPFSSQCCLLLFKWLLITKSNNKSFIMFNFLEPLGSLILNRQLAW